MYAQGAFGEQRGHSEREHIGQDRLESENSWPTEPFSEGFNS
jgi:hypothetical protein